MKTQRGKLALTGVLALSTLFGSLSLLAGPEDIGGCQQGINGASCGQGRQQGGGRMDPARRQEMMETRLKAELDASDEQWDKILPLIREVATRQRDVKQEPRGMQSEGRGPRNRPGAPGGQVPNGRGTPPEGDALGNTPPPPPPNTTDAELAILRQLLDSPTATPEEIQEKLAALRKTRHTRQKELELARKDLKEAVTPRQEAVLVLMGILD
jgi:hypothetical protein